MTWTQYHLLKKAHDAMAKELEAFRELLVKADLEKLEETYSYKYKVTVMVSDGLMDFDTEVLVFCDYEVTELTERSYFSDAELSEITDKFHAIVYELD